ncbi:hypothetical protein AVEN_83502-1 [Araneus ventricosus]|uniref:Uncharacterized protein n=1 Tax=Araneus ventricosus TaxID=182803 RepID=A0A4Y2BVC0_ARAVE|nr:hypothetical protein AVEN_17143-1 [Araneus ventricosus]GBL96207.1 hypothetical protein AVEN_83502-1 [Araneus ventricosus]
MKMAVVIETGYSTAFWGEEKGFIPFVLRSKTNSSPNKVPNVAVDFIPVSLLSSTRLLEATLFSVFSWRLDSTLPFENPRLALLDDFSTEMGDE